VLEAVSKCALAHEIIVVCDGGTDRTADVARNYPKVRVVELFHNVGKGGAMALGAASTNADILCFVDADLINLRPEHVDKIVLPLLAGTCDMCIGVFRGGRFLSDTAQRISPYISGQRAVTRQFFESIPYLADIRLGVEVTINTFAKRQKLRVQKVVLHGVSNTFKEEKMGLIQGAKARTKMYKEIAHAMVKIQRRELAAKRKIKPITIKRGKK